MEISTRKIADRMGYTTKGNALVLKWHRKGNLLYKTGRGLRLIDSITSLIEASEIPRSIRETELLNARSKLFIS